MPCCRSNPQASGEQFAHTLMQTIVSWTAFISSMSLGLLDSLRLTLAALLIVFARYSRHHLDH